MKIFFAGMEAKENVWLMQKSGAKNALLSAYYMNYKKDIVIHKKVFDNILVDSGGFTARIMGKEVNVLDYANYLKKNEVKVAFNLDTNDVEETIRNQKFLEEHTDTYIIPVYHLSDYLDDRYRGLIDDYVRDYPYISVGGIAGASLARRYENEFYNYVFARTKNTVKVHGLGITSKKTLMNYPFYSVDSTSWLLMQKYGRSNSPMSEPRRKWRAKHLHRFLKNIEEVKYFIRLEDEVTKLWAKRGVKWE